jgi:comEA protein
MRVSARSLLPFAFCCVFVCAFAAFSATKKPPTHPIDINSASSAQLQEVPGIGPATADKILQMRKSYGAFKSVDDLLSVRGIGPKRLEKMRKYLVAGHAVPRKGAGGPPSASTTKPASCSGCARTPPVKQGAVAPPKVPKPVAPGGDTAEVDEEPE